MDFKIMEFSNLDFEKEGAFLVLISPKDAEQILAERNYEKNRRISRHNVDGIAHDMKTGQWLSVYGDDPLKFTTDGILLNGQHRLSALVKSEMTLPFLVLTCVPLDAYRVMDHNRTRSVADAFSDKPSPSSVAALAKAYLNVRRGYSYKTHDGDEPVTKQDVIAFLDDNYDYLLRFVRDASRLQGSLPVKRGRCCSVSFALLMACEKDEQCYKEFVSAFVDGDPRTAKLRETLIAALSSPSRPADAWVTGTILNAFDLLLRGKKVKMLNRYKLYLDRYTEYLRQMPYPTTFPSDKY